MVTQLVGGVADGDGRSRSEASSVKSKVRLVQNFDDDDMVRLTLRRIRSELICGLGCWILSGDGARRSLGMLLVDVEWLIGERRRGSETLGIGFDEKSSVQGFREDE